MIILAALLPWLALLFSGHFFQAALCLGLQLSLIGWIPAAIWAIIVVRDDARERQYRQMVQRLRT